MYSVLYPESNFWWVFRYGSGRVPKTFHILLEEGEGDFFNNLDKKGVTESKKMAKDVFKSSSRA